jgi:serine/threonine protein phosphatase PrpC
VNILPRQAQDKHRENSQKKTVLLQFREQHVENGFLLLACDGLWDEMGNEEAVSVVAVRRRRKRVVFSRCHLIY